MPWGLYFPGTLVRSQPVSLFAAIGFFIIWLYFLKVERDWRSWAWYKSKAPGLIFLFLLALGVGLTLFIDFLTVSEVYWLGLKTAASVFLLLAIGAVIFDRSGNRGIWSKKIKK
jgi:hypothetical protein